jgi:hypothetical protein
MAMYRVWIQDGLLWVVTVPIPGSGSRFERGTGTGTGTYSEAAADVVVSSFSDSSRIFTTISYGIMLMAS